MRKKKSTIGDNSAGLMRHFEFLSREFENGCEWSSFWNTKSEIRFNINEIFKTKSICANLNEIFMYIYIHISKVERNRT